MWNNSLLLLHGSTCNRFLRKENIFGKNTDIPSASGNHTQVYDCLFRKINWELRKRFTGFFQKQCYKCNLIKSRIYKIEYM